MTNRVPTNADTAVKECIIQGRSFALIAGAGSGKTTSLVDALKFIRDQYGNELRKNGQRIACITYTKRAVEVVASRLDFDDLFLVSTLHSFLWAQIGRFSRDIREALIADVIPKQIAKAREKDTGRQTKEAVKAREQIVRLEEQLAGLEGVPSFQYDDSVYSDYLAGRLNHDDVIAIAGYILAQKSTFRRLLGFRFPYIFVDEAQDTFQNIVDGLNQACAEDGLPLVGYFGDPWQQIYEDRAGAFTSPPGGLSITKEENFRSSQKVIDLLNAFREDVKQFPAGSNAEVVGSVEAVLVRAEDPEGPRKQYSEDQLTRALERMDQVIVGWGWQDRNDVIRLFLVRQMIARRLGFSQLHKLFTGRFASQRAQDDYESGEHFLLKPFVRVLCPLIEAFQKNDTREIINILRNHSPHFDVHGANSQRPLREMIAQSNEILTELSTRWQQGTTRELLEFCRDRELFSVSERLGLHLAREPRPEEYNDDDHKADKADWLCDQFLLMQTSELQIYCEFIHENTAYSTQHGVKGEQYPNVMVVFDDTEANWSHYSFTKLLTPQTAGSSPTEGQYERGRKLAYVCFSRAEENLRILLFTPNPEGACRELVARNLLAEDQIRIVG